VAVGAVCIQTPRVEQGVPVAVQVGNKPVAVQVVQALQGKDSGAVMGQEQDQEIQRQAQVAAVQVQ